MAKIFISYRRTDSAPSAGRIRDRLAQRFGKKNIFMDIDDIPPGVNFGTYIRTALRQCSVALIIIGHQWLETGVDEGGRRLDNPSDWVRFEVETALALGLTVIPVLVDGASMPAEDSLPPSLRSLALVNAIEVRNDPNFSSYMERLIARLKHLLAARAPIWKLPGWRDRRSAAPPLPASTTSAQPPSGIQAAAQHSSTVPDKPTPANAISAAILGKPPTKETEAATTSPDATIASPSANPVLPRATVPPPKGTIGRPTSKSSTRSPGARPRPTAEPRTRFVTRSPRSVKSANEPAYNVWGLLGGLALLALIVVPMSRLPGSMSTNAGSNDTDDTFFAWIAATTLTILIGPGNYVGVAIAAAVRSGNWWTKTMLTNSFALAWMSLLLLVALFLICQLVAAIAQLWSRVSYASRFAYAFIASLILGIPGCWVVALWTYTKFSHGVDWTMLGVIALVGTGCTVVMTVLSGIGIAVALA